MKKICLILFLGFFLIKISYCQTYVSGLINSNTTWTVTGNPYIVTGNVLVNTGVTLTVEPGVIVKFNSGKALQIRGILRAIGTSSDKITFTSNLPTPASADWSNILFYDQAQSYDSASGTGCILNHCIVEYAGEQIPTSDFAAIKSDVCTPYIKNCTVRNNRCNGIYIYNAATNIRIDSCIAENNYGGISGSSSASVAIENCTVYNCNGGFSVSGYTLVTFINNIVENGFGGVGLSSANIIYCFNNKLFNNNYSDFSLFSEYLYASNNYFTHNATCSLGVYSKYGYFKKNIIVCNEWTSLNIEDQLNSTFIVSNNIYADNFESGAVTLNNCVFTKNTIYSNSVYNYSLYSYQNDGCHNNTICGQTVVQSYSPSVLSLIYTSSPNFINNNVFHNEGYVYVNNYLQTEPDFYLQNNWWGTSNDSIIQTDLIYDWFDNSSLGIVIYQPFLTEADTIAPISPPYNLTKSDLGGGSVLLTWDPNPESDLAGYKVYWGSPTGYSFANSIDVGNVTSYILSGVNYSDTIAVTAYDNLTTGIDDQFNGNESWFAHDVEFPFVGISHNYLQNQKFQITAFPNPAQDILHVVMSDRIQNGSIIIYDLLGQKLFSKTNIDSSDEIISVSKFQKGVYLLFVEENNQKVGLIRIIKE